MVLIARCVIKFPFHDRNLTHQQSFTVLEYHVKKSSTKLQSKKRQSIDQQADLKGIWQGIQADPVFSSSYF